jgi:iron only hydrogenase large subunit-like protein/signal transduction histidine kinase
MTLRPVIEVIKEKCINCHRCIMVCPVKMCNDGSGEVILHHSDLCISCGKCIKACTHGARIGIDDFNAFIEDIKTERIVAVVSPSIVSSFGERYLNVNGFLSSLGVAAVFDESFGAELAVKSYADYMEKTHPVTIIAQTCPTIVSYVEMYRPGLLPHLAPVDTPVTHTMKMIKKYYPAYADCKIAVISPCYAHRIELDSTGIGDYNVTFASIMDYMKERAIDVADYPEIAYTNPPAERAVLFPIPGGLTHALCRYKADIREKSRRIEGDSVYRYLAYLSDSFKKGITPFLIDCLNCEMGCNGGPATGNTKKHRDEVEFPVEKRGGDALKQYEKDGAPDTEKLESVLAAYWEDGLYTRRYTDRSAIFKNTVISPTREQIKDTFVKMHKTKRKHFLNCGACGYLSCEQMAVAIINGLNKPENCHCYVELETLQRSLAALQIERDEIAAMKDNLKAGVFLMDKEYIVQDNYSRALEDVLAATELQGRKFTEFMEDSLNERELKSLEWYFNSIISRSIDQEHIDSMNILKEVRYRSIERPVRKILSCEFAPVNRQNGEVFILGTIEDITSEIVLKKKLQLEERSRLENMRSFSEVLRLERTVFSNFIANMEYNLLQITSALKDKTISSSTLIDVIAPIIHTIKQETIALGLQDLAENLYDVEDVITQMRAETDVSFDTLLTLAIEIENTMRIKDKLINDGGTIFSKKLNSTIQHREYIFIQFLMRICNYEAMDFNKKVRFFPSEIDSEAIQYVSRSLIRQILVQLIRNAVQHGIESPAERRAAGKTERGNIILHITQSEHTIDIKFTDDGKGIDFDHIRKKALNLHIIREEASYDKNILVQVMFTEGFSSDESDGYNDTGLNLVYNKVRELNGSIKVQSQPGKGTAFIITIPKE